MLGCLAALEIAPKRARSENPPLPTPVPLRNGTSPYMCFKLCGVTLLGRTKMLLAKHLLENFAQNPTRRLSLPRSAACAAAARSREALAADDDDDEATSTRPSRKAAGPNWTHKRKTRMFPHTSMPPRSWTQTQAIHSAKSSRRKVPTNDTLPLPASPLGRGHRPPSVGPSRFSSKPRPSTGKVVRKQAPRTLPEEARAPSGTDSAAGRPP